MTLNKRLEFLDDAMFRNADDRTRDLCRCALRNNAQFATNDGAVIEAPEWLEDETVLDREGRSSRLLKLISANPCAILFFRGSWCPFSVTSMRAMQQISGKLKRLGSGMIGVTPENHRRLTDATLQNGLHYPLVTDPEMKLCEAMGIRVPVIERMRSLYEAEGVDLAEINESGEWALPLEATFLVDRTGRVREANAYPTPARRMEPADVLKIMQALCAERADA